MVKRSNIFYFLAKNLILISFIYEIVDSSTIQNEDIVSSRVRRDVFSIEDFDADKEEKPDRSSLYNPEYFEGDITNYGLSSHTLKELTGEEKGVATGRNAIANPLSKWNKVGGYVIIPFELSNDFTPYPITVIDRAFQEFQKRTCIKFVERTAANYDYIYIEPGEGCNSAVGKQGGKQVVSLAYDCLRGKDAVGIAIHELMHTVGFFHEQSRNDRDYYVTIDWNNVADNAKDNNFEKYNFDKITHLGTSYDYESIMHYDMYAFSKNNQPTIRPTRNGVEIGQRKGFSTNDVYKINKLYDCFQLRGQQPINNRQIQRTTVAPFRQIQRTPVFPSQTVANNLQRKPLIVGFNCRSTYCHDANQCCALWKLKGKCESNRGWMSCNCRLSCGYCSVDFNYRDPAACFDNNPSCSRWAWRGECVKNPLYMKKNCRASCRVCLSLYQLKQVCK